ncbi:ATP-binding protein [Candidatus Phytoplasma solani]|uniref:ATP-binding protein n=1 Tax=Candidatus Phytoplasma solani TaxID=69896 RepID=UPI0032DBDD4B
MKKTNQNIFSVLVVFLFILGMLGCGFMLWQYIIIKPPQEKQLNTTKELPKPTEDNQTQENINTQENNDTDETKLLKDILAMKIPQEKLNKKPSLNDTIISQTAVRALKSLQSKIIDPQRFLNAGIKFESNGVCLYGPPGNGKTIAVESLGKDCGMPFFLCNGGDFAAKYKGVAPKKVRLLWQHLRKEAQEHGACILFVDESEDIFTDISQIGESSSDNAVVVNEFKTEMTSLDNDPKKPIFVLCATNHVDKLDKAILSRLGTKIEIPNLDVDLRVKMLQLLVKFGAKISPTAQNQFKQIAQRIEGLKHNDLIKSARGCKNFVNDVKIYALEAHNREVAIIEDFNVILNRLFEDDAAQEAKVQKAQEEEEKKSIESLRKQKRINELIYPPTPQQPQDDPFLKALQNIKPE